MRGLRGMLLLSIRPPDPRGLSSGGVFLGAVAPGKPVWLGGSRVLYAIGCPKTVEIFVACDYMFERPSNCAVCNNC